MRLEDTGPLTDEQRAELEGGEEFPFGTVGLELTWRPKERHVLLVADDGALVASTGLVTSRAEVDGSGIVPVVGVGGVIVAPPHRGEGHARTVVEAALERAATLGPRFALLFCRPGVAGLYQRLGFATIPGPVVVQQPGGKAAKMPQLTMWRALHDGTQWPPGRVRLLDLPF